MRDSSVTKESTSPQNSDASSELATGRDASLSRRAAGGIVWAQAGSFAEVVLGFALSILVIRKLGPSDYGTYGLLVSITSLLPLLCRLGFDEILGRYVPIFMEEGRKERVTYLMRILLVGRLIAVAIALGSMGLTMAFLSHILQIPDFSSYFVLLALMFGLQEFGQLFASFFTAHLSMQAVTLSHLLNRTISLGLTLLLFSKLGIKVEYVLLAAIVGLAAGLVWYLVRSRKQLWETPAVSVPMKQPLQFGIKVYFVNMAQLGLSAQKDILLLGILASDIAEVGYYKAALGLVVMMHGFLFSRWSGMNLPVLSEAYKRRGAQGLQETWTAYIRLMSLIGVPVFGYFAAFSVPIVNTLIGSDYESSIALLRIWSLITLITTAMGHGLSTLVLYAINREGTALIFRISGAVVGIVLAVLLIPVLGALGAMTASAVVTLGIIIAEVLFAAHYVKGLRYPIRFLGKVALATLIGCWPALLLHTEQVWSFIAASVLFGISFLVALHFLKPLEKKDREVLAQVESRLAVAAKWF